MLASQVGRTDLRLEVLFVAAQGHFAVGGPVGADAGPQSDPHDLEAERCHRSGSSPNTADCPGGRQVGRRRGQTEGAEADTGFDGEGDGWHGGQLHVVVMSTPVGSVDHVQEESGAESEPRGAVQQCSSGQVDHRPCAHGTEPASGRAT